MARLRDPKTGCEWDSVQTFATIAPYTIEEAYEVADAIARNDMADLKDELGDLLLQVVFHARIAEEAGAFDLNDVVATISDKMERRHPHIFGDAAEGGHYLWEQIKAEERAAKARQGALDGVALGLPALLRAEKLQKRAARTGFDWPDASGPRAKVSEELAEADEAIGDHKARRESAICCSRWSTGRATEGIDAEAALRAANAKFERRFRAMEAEAGERFAGARSRCQGGAVAGRQTSRWMKPARNPARPAGPRSRSRSSAIHWSITSPCACSHAAPAPSAGSRSI